jgi:carbon-monoxide dehydrogenase medium subunit
LLHDAVRVIGDVQIRNMGTIGGSLVHADPAGDVAPALLALDARVTSVTPRGTRTRSVDEILLDAYAADMAADEVVTDIAIPVPAGKSGGAYLKLERKAGDFAVASAGVQLRLERGDRCQSIAISLGAVDVKAVRAPQAEALLTGQKITDELVREAASLISEQVSPLADIRGSAEYRKHLAGVLFRRALDVAVRRAQGEEVKDVHV